MHVRNNLSIEKNVARNASASSSSSYPGTVNEVKKCKNGLVLTINPIFILAA